MSAADLNVGTGRQSQFGRRDSYGIQGFQPHQDTHGTLRAPCDDGISARLCGDRGDGDDCRFRTRAGGRTPGRTVRPHLQRQRALRWRQRARAVCRPHGADVRLRPHAAPRPSRNPDQAAHRRDRAAAVPQSAARRPTPPPAGRHRLPFPGIEREGCGAPGIAITSAESAAATIGSGHDRRARPARRCV